MTCDTYTAQLSAYLDRALTGEEEARLESHLANCASCSAELRSLQQLVQRLQTMEQPNPPDLVPAVHRALQQLPWWHNALQRLRASWPATLPLHGLALATAGVLIVLLVSLPGYIRMHPALEPEMTDRLSQEAAPSSATSLADKRLRGKQKSVAPEEQHRSLKAMATTRGASLARLAEPVLDEKKLEEDSSRGKEVFENRQPLVDAPRAAARVLTPASAGVEGRVVASGGRLRLDQGVFGGTGSMSSVAETTNQPQQGYASSINKEAAVHQEKDDVAALQAASAPFSGVTGGGGAYQQMNGSPITGVTVSARTIDPAAARTAVSDWVEARHGYVAAINEHRLAIMLPSSTLAAFLQQFSIDDSDVVQALRATPPAAWVALQLELVPSQATQE